MGRGLFLAVSLSSMLGGFVVMVAGGRAQGGVNAQYYPVLRSVVPIALMIIAPLVVAWTVYIVAFCKGASPPKRRSYRRIRFEILQVYFDKNHHEYTLYRGDPSLRRTQPLYEMPAQGAYEFVPPDAIKSQEHRKRR